MVNKLNLCPQIGYSNNNKNFSEVKNNRVSNNIENLLERIPNKDVINFSGSATNKVISKSITYRDIEFLKNNTEYSRPTFWNGDYTMDYENPFYPEDNYHLYVEDKVFSKKVKGRIADSVVDLKVKYAMLNALKGKITGTIDGIDVNIKYEETSDGKGLKLVVSPQFEDIVPVLSLLAYDNAEN